MTACDPVTKQWVDLSYEDYPGEYPKDIKSGENVVIFRDVVRGKKLPCKVVENFM